MPASQLVDADDPFDPSGLLAGTNGLAWRPAGVDEALRVLDRVARYCSFSCVPDGPGCTEACDAWRVERAAAAYLAGRWLDVQD